MTATDDYSKVVRGAGPLKLKGVKGAKVEKKRKKTPSVDKIPSEPRSPAGGDVASEPKDKDVASFKEPGVMKDGTKGKADDRPRDVYKPRKTEAELRHEEMRRRRVSLGLQEPCKVAIKLTAALCVAPRKSRERRHENTQTAC